MLADNRELPKSERLCSKKTTEELFKKGSSVYLHPFRLLVLPRTDGVAAYPQVLFSVPKRNFKRANRRNLIRRRLREIYRLHKFELLHDVPAGSLPRCVAVLYIGKDILPSDVLARKFKGVWQKWRQTGGHSSETPAV